VSIEKNGIKSWQTGGRGKRVGLTRPGMFQNALRWETGVLLSHGLATSYTALPTHQFPLTSQCLCGEKSKWRLSDRIITCPNCGLGPVDRDLHSAYKARLIGETGATTLDGGILSTKENRAQALALCGVGEEAPTKLAAHAGNKTSVQRSSAGASAQEGVPLAPGLEMASDLFRAALPGRRASGSQALTWDKRGNTRAHTDPVIQGRRTRTPREATPMSSCPADGGRGS
jgi:YD repeat-containing protein